MSRDKMTPEKAAELLGISPQLVRIGLQQGVFPFGVAIRHSKNYSYDIRPDALRRYMEVGIPGRDAVDIQ